MILKPDEKVHVIHRRLLDKEPRRHFVGVVEAYENGIARVTGHLYTVDRTKSAFIRRPEKRTRILALGSGDLLVNVIPDSVRLDRIVYQSSTQGVRVTDGGAWSLDMSELAWT